MRIYVGGLGSSVEEDDLKKTFTSPLLGDVQSVEIIRTKGRAFAYLDFLPASAKGLAKLFSTYNGCLWKGGRLKLEKAKEDYLVCLRREWAEDAHVEAKLCSQNVDKVESVVEMQKPKKDHDIENLQLKIFFPKLRKIKAIPLKGSGKHKYSFQCVEVRSNPIHFCDCEEHSGPPEPPKRSCTDNDEIDNYGANEGELNLMKSVLSKLLEKDTRSDTLLTEAKLTEETNHDVSLADTWRVDDSEEDQLSDEDNLVINMVGQSNKRISSFEDFGLQTATANQLKLPAPSDFLVREPESFRNPTLGMHGNENGKHLIEKKRKQFIPDNKSTDTMPSKKKGKKLSRHDDIDNQVAENTQPIVKELGSVCKGQVCEKANTVFRVSDIWSNQKSEGEDKTRSDQIVISPSSNENDAQQGQSSKSGLEALVSEKGGIVCSVSDTLTDLNSEGERKPGFDHVSIAPCSNENDGQENQSSKYKESEEFSDAQTTKTTTSIDKSARGASWLQKSSWLQLVADANTSAFNLAQILPESSAVKQESQEFKGIDFSNLKGKQHDIVLKDQESPIEVQERGNTGSQAGLRNPGVDVVTKGKDHGALLVSDLKEESSISPSLGVDTAPNKWPLGDTVISVTCPFMRSAASEKEWLKSKSKVALSQSHKKKGMMKKWSE